MKAASFYLSALLFASSAWAEVTGVVSGHLRDASSGLPIASWNVIVSGPALSREENSSRITLSGSDGRYNFDLPPGTYELQTSTGKYQGTQTKLEVAAGGSIVRDFELKLETVSKAYRVEDVELPRQMVPEISGLAFTPRGTLVAVTRRGEVWMRDGASGIWRLFARGLLEPFGVIADSDRDVYVTSRGQFVHVIDTAGSGRADLFTVIDDTSGMTGNYHEFAYGLVRDRFGNFFGANGLASKDGDNFQGIVAKGQLKFEKNVAGFSNDDHRSLVPYEGWVYEITPAGVFVPFATGFRQAMGLGISPQGELFATDVSGSWVPTSILLHVQKGRFYSHPDGLKWDPNFEGRPVTPEMIRQMRTPPVVYVPRGPLGSGLGEPVWDTTEGRFGPFAGQMFITDWTGVVVRVDLEMVASDYQGAVFLFAAGQGLNIGGVREVFGPDGSLYIGQTLRGWGSTAKEGIQRIVWTGKTPVEIRTLHLTPRGFAMSFTVPMNTSGLGLPINYHVNRFQYNYSIDDGSLRTNETDVPVTRAIARPDGMGVDIELAELLPDFIYEVGLNGIRSAAGETVANPVAYYTANRLLAGTAPPARSILASKPVVLTAPDPAAGKIVFQTNCVVCHQPDGRGSKQVGTPDFTQPHGPLSKPDAALINQITNGGKAMPPFGHVLPPQDILDVLAFVRQKFGQAPTTK
jgi:mono/diheme cytochrome c family protein